MMSTVRIHKIKKSSWQRKLKTNEKLGGTSSFTFLLIGNQRQINKLSKSFESNGYLINYEIKEDRAFNRIESIFRLHHFIQSRKIQNFILVGIGSGAAVTLSYALYFDFKGQGLVLKDFGKDLFYQVFERTPNSVYHEEDAKATDTSENKNALSTSFSKQDLKKLQFPVLLLHSIRKKDHLMKALELLLFYLPTVSLHVFNKREGVDLEQQNNVKKIMEDYFCDSKEASATN